MNTNTAKKLDALCDQIQILASAVMIQIGITTAADIMSAAHDLKCALKNDETIKETK